MNRYITCKNCGEENFFYVANCTKCASVLRNKVVNLDFWDLLLTLTESPSKAFDNIIISEHKNYLFIVFAFASIKIFLLTYEAQIYLQQYLGSFFSKIPLLFILTFGIIFIFSKVLVLIDKKDKYISLLKNYIAVLGYSLFPYVIGLFILQIIELIVFGSILFTNWPKPFDTKPFFAYVLLGFEVLIILWSLFLTSIGLYRSTGKKIFSIVIAIIFQISIFISFYLLNLILR